MGEFMSFWRESMQEAFDSAWGLVGGVDLVITILGAIAYESAKSKGPSWLKGILNHPVLSDKWRLCAIFMGWFIFATLLLAPYWQYQKAQGEKADLNQKIDTLEQDTPYALSVAQTALQFVYYQAENGNPQKMVCYYDIGLKNNIDHPIQFTVRKIELDGQIQEGLLNTSEGISPKGGTSLYTNPVPQDISNGLPALVQHYLSLEIAYGLVGEKPTRLLKKNYQIQTFTVNHLTNAHDLSGSEDVPLP